MESLQATVAQLSLELAACKDLLHDVVHNAQWFFGLVDGGSDRKIKCFKEKPTAAMSKNPPSATATVGGGRWLRLSLPRIAFEVQSPDGTRLETWYRVHYVNPKTAEPHELWVRDADDMGNATFKRFQTVFEGSPGGPSGGGTVSAASPATA